MTIYDSDQQAIAKKLEKGSDKTNWTDWRWHLKNSIRDVETFQRLLGVEFGDKAKAFNQVVARFPLSVTPYYLSLIDSEDWENDPVFKQAFPQPQELNISSWDMADPLHEDKDSPVPGLTHRYPDRVLFHVSNICSMYCRHCTRKRKVGDASHIPSREQMLKGIQYIKDTPQVRDVLLSGGDPFMLPDQTIDWLLGELRDIDHVEIIRIGSRMPAVLPYRITPELLDVLKKYHPLWLNTHFNHPREITTSSSRALAMIADAGIPLGNQSVLLAGVNDCPSIIKSLCTKLVANRVRPYYLYQCDLSEGLSHFRTPIGRGMEIMESLIGHTSGFARPTYVIDAPGGGGKIPIMPNYVVSWGVNKIVLRNYEGVITIYREPDEYDTSWCDHKCDECTRHLKLDGASEYKATGIEKLLSEEGEVSSLTPGDLERHARSHNNGN